MIIVIVKEQEQGSDNPPMAYRAATYGFQNQGLTEMISLAYASSEHSHAPKPPGSPNNLITVLVNDTVEILYL